MTPTRPAVRARSTASCHRRTIDGLRRRQLQQARAAAEHRHHDPAFRVAIAEQAAGGVPLTEAEQHRTLPMSCWPRYRRSSSGSAPCAGRPRAATGTAAATGASSLRLGAAGPDAPRDQLRAPRPRRTRPGATSTESATTN